MSFMNNEQLRRRIVQPNTTLTPGESKRAFQLIVSDLDETMQKIDVLIENINALENRLESLRGPESSKSTEAKDKASGTRGRGRPRKSNAEGSDEEGSA